MLERAKIGALLQLIRFDKPIGTLLLLWPTLWALWIAADGIPDIDLLLIFVAGTFLMRSAGCIVNDLADRHIDGSITRTQTRPLVTGAVTVNEAIVFCTLLSLAAFVLVLFTSTLTILLSLVAVALAAIYPFMKRHTNLPQIFLGAAFSWGIPMAFAAQINELPMPLWLIFTANLLWTVVYDTQYAMADRAEDLKVGVKSTAIMFGDADKLIIGILQGLCLLALYLAGERFDLGLPYQLSLVVVLLLFIYHQYLIRNRESGACFQAFKHNNWVGMTIFIGVAAHYHLAVGS
jgi:4-hydroxybenzoate polyprenyltransferase